MTFMYLVAMPQIKRLVAGFQLWRSGFIQMAVQVFAEKWRRDCIFSHVFQVIAVVIIPPMLHIYLFMSGDPLDVAALLTSRSIRIKNHVSVKENILSLPYPPKEINSTCIKCNLSIITKNNNFYCIQQYILHVSVNTTIFRHTYI